MIFAWMLRKNWSWAEVAGVALVYYAAARLGLLLQLPGTNASPVWPPSGIGLAALMMFGLRVWPGIMLGAFLANLLTLPSTPAGVLASSAICAGNTLEAVVALVLLRRFVPSSDPFDRARDVFKFVLTASLACAVASTGGTASLWLAGIIPAEIVGRVWLTWWLGDVAGMLVLTPALVCWWRSPRPGFSAAKTLELVVLVVLSVGTTDLLFDGWMSSNVITSLPYLVVIPSLLWAAIRFGPRESASLAVLMSAIAIARSWWWSRPGEPGAAPQTLIGPFLSPTISANDSLLMLQIFVCAIAVTAIALAAAVAERTQAEGSLRESEQRFRTIFEQAAVGVALIETATGRFARINQRYADLVGYSIDEMTRTDFSAITHPDDLQPYLENMRRLIAGEVSEFSVEKRYLRKDGMAVWTNLTVSAAWRPGETPENHIAVVEDITERKRSEEARNAALGELKVLTRELEAFSYSVSHDLRTPLRAIDGFSRILQEDYAGKFDDEGRRLLKVIRDNSQRMGRLIDDLLTFSRLSGKPLASAEIDMKRLVEEVLGDIHLAGERRAEVVLGALPPARGDAALVKQVWVNLLENAIKFSAKREQPVVELSGYADAENNVYCVKDNGVGFEMQYYDKLFGVFQRLHGMEEFPGTGVGLAIVQRVVSRHGGRVWGEGKVNEGATFHFSLPKG